MINTTEIQAFVQRNVEVAEKARKAKEAERKQQELEDKATATVAKKVERQNKTKAEQDRVTNELKTQIAEAAAGSKTWQEIKVKVPLESAMDKDFLRLWETNAYELQLTLRRYSDGGAYYNGHVSYSKKSTFARWRSSIRK